MHAARIISKWLSDGGVRVIRWPAIFSDWNRIEHTYSILEEIVYAISGGRHG